MRAGSRHRAWRVAHTDNIGFFPPVPMAAMSCRVQDTGCRVMADSASSKPVREMRLSTLLGHWRFPGTGDLHCQSGIGGVGYIGLCTPRPHRVRPARPVQARGSRWQLHYTILACRPAEASFHVGDPHPFVFAAQLLFPRRHRIRHPAHAGCAARKARLRGPAAHSDCLEKYRVGCLRGIDSSLPVGARIGQTRIHANNDSRVCSVISNCIANSSRGRRIRQFLKP